MGEGLSQAVAAALGAERVRNLRGLSWLRLIVAVASGGIGGALALRQGAEVARVQVPLFALGVVVAGVMLRAAYRSRWYQDGGWLAVGGWDFASLWLTSAVGIEQASEPGRAVALAVGGVAVVVAMIGLSVLLLYPLATAGAAVLGAAVAVALLVQAGEAARAPVALLAIGGATAVALYLVRRRVARWR